MESIVALLDAFMDEQQRPAVHEGMGAPELVEALRAGDTAVQKKALKALMRQPVALHDADPWVRAHAAEALGRLAPHALAPFAPAVAALLADVAPQVRRAAADALAELPPAQLAAHAPFLFSNKTRKHLFRCTSNGQGFTLHWMQEARLGPYIKRRAQLQGELNSLEVMMDARRTHCLPINKKIDLILYY